MVFAVPVSATWAKPPASNRMLREYSPLIEIGSMLVTKHSVTFGNSAGELLWRSRKRYSAWHF